MISFIWDDKNPMYSGRGGMENFTAGHVRELALMGIESQVVTIGLGHKNSNEYFPDIKFLNIDSLNDLSSFDHTIVFINVPHNIETQEKSYVLFHCPPRLAPRWRSIYQEAIKNKSVIVASRYMQSIWAEYLDISEEVIDIVYPFADPHFADVRRPTPSTDLTNVIFAGRLMPEKGVYLYLEAIHLDILRSGYNFSITNAGNQTEHGRIIEKLIKAHPFVNVVEARHTPGEMAKLLAQHQILVMPSTPYYWHEGFGMLSVEAQHAGCYVIGSNDGGLPESDCGGLTLFEAGNPLSLAEAIRDVSQYDPITPEEKAKRTQFFTRNQSATKLMSIIDK